MLLIIPWMLVFPLLAVADNWSHAFLNSAEFSINIDFKVSFVREEESKQITDELYINLYYPSIQEEDVVEATLTNFTGEGELVASYYCHPFRYVSGVAPHFVIHLQDCQMKRPGQEEWSWPIFPLVVRRSIKQSLQETVNYQTLKIRLTRGGGSGEVVELIDPWSQTSTFRLNLYEAFIAKDRLLSP